jgi:hypothetical protein
MLGHSIPSKGRNRVPYGNGPLSIPTMPPPTSQTGIIGWAMGNGY